jgi:hypothetical protein
VKNRRSLTPPHGVPMIEGVHAMRRTGGARREVSSRVCLTGLTGAGPDGEEMHEGWALNVSRGGVRVVLEQKLELGKEYDVTVGDPDNGGTRARGRIVWVQEEPDGAICGVEFVGMSGTHESVPPPPPEPEPAPTT